MEKWRIDIHPIEDGYMVNVTLRAYVIFSPDIHNAERVAKQCTKENETYVIEQMQMPKVPKNG